ncbi:hypothetical protein DRN74_02305 [Candidatus Micrarchaeota archaeon]|nr:MAG: hypothetical protein DRN74_02305 [Candidatus Micrarchaeota archaeon]
MKRYAPFLIFLFFFISIAHSYIIVEANSSNASYNGIIGLNITVYNSSGSAVANVSLNLSVMGSPSWASCSVDSNTSENGKANASCSFNNAINGTYNFSVHSASYGDNNSVQFRILQHDEKPIFSVNSSIAYSEKNSVTKFELYVINKNNYQTEFNFSHSNISDFNCSFNNSLMSLPPISTLYTNIFSCSVNNSVAAGSYNITIWVNASNNKSISSELNLTLHVRPRHNFTLSNLSNTRGSIEAGKSFSFTFLLNNTGETAVNYSINPTANNSWACGVNASNVVDLQVNKTVNISVSFRTSVTAPYNETGVCTVTVTDSYGLEKNISFNLSADKHYNLSLHLPRSPVDNFDDGNLSFLLNVSNDGNSGLSFNISVDSSSANWNISWNISSTNDSTKQHIKNLSYFIQNFSLTTINISVVKPQDAKCGDSTTLWVELSSAHTDKIVRSIRVEYPCLKAVPAITYNHSSKLLSIIIPNVTKGGETLNRTEAVINLTISDSDGNSIFSVSNMTVDKTYNKSLSNTAASSFRLHLHLKKNGSSDIVNDIYANFAIYDSIDLYVRPTYSPVERGDTISFTVESKLEDKWLNPSISCTREGSKNCGIWLENCRWLENSGTSRTYRCDIKDNALLGSFDVSFSVEASSCADSTNITCTYDPKLSASDDCTVNIRESEDNNQNSQDQQENQSESSQEEQASAPKLSIKNLKQGEVFKNTKVLSGGFVILVENDGGAGQLSASINELGAVKHFYLDIDYNQSIEANSTARLVMKIKPIENTKPGVYNIMLKVNDLMRTFKVPVMPPEDNKNWHRFFEVAKNGSTIITLRVKNTRNGPNNFTVTERIPKEAARTADGVFVISPSDYVVIEKDPVIKWIVKDVAPGREFDIVYMIGRNVTNINFPKPEIGESYIYSVGRQAHIVAAGISRNPQALLVLFGVLISASIWFFMYKKGLLEPKAYYIPRAPKKQKRRAGAEDFVMQYSLDANKERHSVYGPVLAEYSLFPERQSPPKEKVAAEKKPEKKKVKEKQGHSRRPALLKLPKIKALNAFPIIKKKRDKKKSKKKTKKKSRR